MNKFEEGFNNPLGGSARSHTISLWAPIIKYCDGKDNIIILEDIVEYKKDRIKEIGESLKRRQERRLDFEAFNLLDSIQTNDFDFIGQEKFNCFCMSSEIFYELQKFIRKEENFFLPELVDIENEFNIKIIVDDIGFRDENNKISPYYKKKILLCDDNSPLVKIEEIEKPFITRREYMNLDCIISTAKYRFNLTNKPYVLMDFV